ncbi:MAG: RDD family protein [Rhodocyclaceae bacterium]|nr:RDD family protein [Rhodocyclaceae bacterium]MBX3667262.1 RDD family protein [Rhodocyclaceae bacterium]
MATSLDTLRLVETPEGCRLSLRLAGPLSRARAWFLDLLLRIVILMLVGQVLGFLGKFGAGIMTVIAFALEWLYPVLFEVLWDGATPGKRMLGMAVLHDDGTAVGWGASFVRNTLRAVDFLPFLYGVGLSSTLLSKDGKRLGDLAAGTVVVWRPAESTKPPAVAQVSPEPPPLRLTQDEQRVILEFAARARTLTDERAQELADLVKPLLGDAPDSVRKLLAVAAWLQGHRTAGSADNAEKPVTNKA